MLDPIRNYLNTIATIVNKPESQPITIHQPVKPELKTYDSFQDWLSAFAPSEDDGHTGSSRSDLPRATLVPEMLRKADSITDTKPSNTLRIELEGLDDSREEHQIYRKDIIEVDSSSTVSGLIEKLREKGA
jgi:hypothetical protein